MRRTLITGLAVMALASTPVLALTQTATAGSAASSASLIASNDGTYVPVTPTRLLDTRSTGKVPVGGTKSVQITGRAGIPTSGVGAVVVNLTVTGGTRSGYLSAYPGTTFPGTSALNFAAGETRANLDTVPVADDGTITVLNGDGSTYGPVNVLVDVQGYYLENTPDAGKATARAAAADAVPAHFFPQSPFRIEDTRDPDSGGPYFPGDEVYYDFYPEDLSSIDLSDVTALALNVTAVNPSASGYLQAWNGDGDAPNASIVNYTKGKITPNNVVVPTYFYGAEDPSDDSIEFGIRNGGGSGSVNLLIDVVGVYSSQGGGLVFRPLASPVRMVDTRSGTGAAKFGPGTTQTINATTSVSNPIAPSLTSALVGNLTAVGPSAATYLTVWPGGARPTVSNLNPAKAQTVANHSYFGLSHPGESPTGQFKVFNAGGSTNVLIDINGYFDSTAVTAAKGAKSSGTAQLKAAKVTASPHRRTH